MKTLSDENENRFVHMSQLDQFSGGMTGQQLPINYIGYEVCPFPLLFHKYHENLMSSFEAASVVLFTKIISILSLLSNGKECNI